MNLCIFSFNSTKEILCQLDTRPLPRLESRNQCRCAMSAEITFHASKSYIDGKRFDCANPVSIARCPDQPILLHPTLRKKREEWGARWCREGQGKRTSPVRGTWGTRLRYQISAPPPSYLDAGRGFQALGCLNGKARLLAGFC